jgi:23S rRNA (guanosine2251-2'-O)-methyltransferase
MGMEFIYGPHTVESRLRLQPETVKRLWVQSGRNDLRMATITDLARKQKIKVDTIPRQELDKKVAGQHQGVVAEVAASTKGWTEKVLLRRLKELDHPALVLVLDGVTDPHNLGACLRSADAAGVDVVVAPKDKAAGLTPAAKKVASGAADVVPFVQVTNLARALDGMKKVGIWLFGTEGEADTSLYESDFTGPVAIVMGAEGKGLRRLTREACDHLVNLPMVGTVESLNVSVAAGICLYEAVRQRSA